MESMENTNKNSDWLKQMADAEAEIACGGVLAGRLGSPDDHPEVPIEDEATLRQFLKDKLQEMLQREAARKKAFQEQCRFPHVGTPDNAERNHPVGS